MSEGCGTTKTYQAGCRCVACRAANADHTRTYRAAHRTEVNNYERARRADIRAQDPQAARYADRVRTLRPYGLSPEQWDAMFEAQGRCCAICLTDDSGGRWHTDHDGTIGKKAVRGILCVRCNIGIGQFKHDPERLRWAVRYLQANNRRLHPEVELPYYLRSAEALT